MIIVSGTKRSGTSMWMQILKGAGVPVLGEDFSKVWKETIYDANPRGFHESVFRNGIYYATNPVPSTGQYLHPSEARGIAVKIFTPGLCRTDLAYIDRVIDTMRHWREYGTSLDRLLTMEKEALSEKFGKERPDGLRLSPLLEWWYENYLLVRDIATRRYPARLISYDRVVNEPEKWLPQLLRWVGAPEPDAGLQAVAPEVRTVEAVSDCDDDASELDDDVRAAFDALYAVAHDGVPLTPELIAQLNAVHEKLSAPISEHMGKVMRARAARRQARLARSATSGTRQDGDAGEKAEEAAEEAGGDEP